MVSTVSYRALKTAAISAIQEVGASLVPQRRLRFDDYVLRKLRSTMVMTEETCANLREALVVIISQIAERTTRVRVRYADVEELIAGRTVAMDGEAEVNMVPIASAAPWQVRRILSTGTSATELCTIW